MFSYLFKLEGRCEKEECHKTLISPWSYQDLPNIKIWPLGFWCWKKSREIIGSNLKKKPKTQGPAYKTNKKSRPDFSPKLSKQSIFDLCVQACSRARGLRNNSIFMSPWKWRWRFYWPQQSHNSKLPDCPCTQPQGERYSLSIQTRTNSTFYFKLFDPAGLERILQSPWRARVTRVQICSDSRQQ